MRKRFEVQLTLGQTAIEQVALPTGSRDELSPILEGLQWIFMTPEAKIQVFDFLEKQIIGDKKATGRTGMDLWHILVLGVVRLGLDCDYDRLEDMANHHLLIRQIMGIGPTFGAPSMLFHHRTISDNVALLDKNILEKINAIVARNGQKIFMKKEVFDEPLEIKIDSYVFETNVHFPTDLTLLWDAQRKCLDYLVELCMTYEISGWRKAENWRSRLKSAMRAVSRVKKAGGPNKTERLLRIARDYLACVLRFEKKVFESWIQLRNCELSHVDTMKLALLTYFHDELIRHIDLVQRRMIDGETIPHEEKVFSLFEPHTEWINKGKLFPPIELGHRVQIATSQHGLIVDYAILDHTADVDALIPAIDRILSRNDAIQSVSADKGYSRKDDRELLELFIPSVVIPKRGRLNKEEQARERQKPFRALRHQHSAIESDINCLECHGLNRCPDKGYRGYGRYVGLGILAYNLHKIGNRLQDEKRAAIKKAA